MSIKLERGQPGHLLVSFDYNEEIVRKLKTIKGSWWNPRAKKWVLPDNQKTVNKLCELFSNTRIIDIRECQGASKKILQNEELIKKLEIELVLGGFSKKNNKGIFWAYTQVFRKLPE